MNSSFFKHEKQPKPNAEPNHQSDSYGLINTLILICKGVLVVANSFLKLNVLNVLIDFLDRVMDERKQLDRNQHSPRMF